MYNESWQYEQILNTLTGLTNEVRQGANGSYFSEVYIGEKLNRLVQQFSEMEYSEGKEHDSDHN